MENTSRNGGPAKAYSSTKRVLIVDDDPIVRKFVMAVANVVGITVIETENGEEALKFLADSGEQLPDLMLVDLYMPHMDGIKYCRTLKERELFPLDRVVVISATSTKRAQELIKSLSVRCFLQKPFTVDDLRKLFSSI